MPVIRIDFDNEAVYEAEIQALSEATQKIVSEVTGIEDVFVYANNSQIKVKVAPIEIFVQLSSNKIKNVDNVVALQAKQIGKERSENKASELTIVSDTMVYSCC